MSTATQPATCTHCEGTGYTLTDDVAKPCACGAAKRHDLAKRIAAATLPARFAGKSFADWRTSSAAQRQILARCQEFARAFDPKRPGGLLFTGNVGGGKTHLSVAILRAVLGRGFRGRYLNVCDFLDELRQSYRPDSPTAGDDLIDEVLRADLIVLDDLGAERVTGWVQERLYALINRLYERLKSVIVSTNLTLGQIADMGADQDTIGNVRVASRLTEMTGPPIDFGQIDYRRDVIARKGASK